MPRPPSPLPTALRPALACVVAILLAMACGLNYPQWAGLIALSTLAGHTGTAVTPATLLPKAAGVLCGAGLALLGVIWCGQERWALLAWLTALVFGCAAGQAWPGAKPFALAVGTTLVPATVFGVNDLPHELTAAWSRVGESFLGFAVVVTLDAALGVFGSGWAFLVIDPQTHKLEILPLPNQDSVLLHGKPGLLCCDVWEHAYYLQRQNRRAEYLEAWWNVVAWDVVNHRLLNFRAGKKQL